MQWLDDEEQVAESDEDVQAILQLYDLAVTDYLSVKADLQYIDGSGRTASSKSSDQVASARRPFLSRPWWAPPSAQSLHSF